MALYLVGISVAYFGAMALLLFGAAGRWDLPLFWAYLTALIVPSAVGGVWLYRRSPELVRERLRPGPGERDPLSVSILIVALAAHLLVAGLDVGRYHWSDSVPLPLQLLGLALFFCSVLIMMWAEGTNQFFSSAVRLQQDRGQYVITTGPYHYVRHPGYAAGVLMFLSSGLALGSWWAGAVMLVAVVRIIWRTALEDRMLQGGLAGYPQYAARVRYRLLPGVW